ncbi:MAG: MlaE family lipid ABC transporter permease subunit [Calditrichaceae bacterium]|nr:MlaE family lipid ABC transporter permease subunit [Calditrichaceae bacterium]MBN2710463.1 MlaE family lipid ABC transporter permease subunit [Calditrichaceae bacterium]RQV93602.1 MAG: MlaE family lipid ABC transporter permease subunit [Calditrichota bacterium]
MPREIIKIPSALGFSNVEEVRHQITKLISAESPQEFILDFAEVESIDTAGVALIDYLNEFAPRFGTEITLTNVSKKISSAMDVFHLKKVFTPEKKEPPGFFEKTGDLFYKLKNSVGDILILLSNITYWSGLSIVRPKLRRKGEVIHQSILIGVNAFPIIALIAFLIGFILALQSAAQLRQFGANIYVADLVAIAMVSEMGPLITAIMVAGRSGSAIAAEIATMVVTEEIDALKVMGIDPAPYLVVPKVMAMSLVMPMLTIFANFIGIIGGMVIAITYLDLDILPFFNEVMSVLRYKELVTSIVKSLTFAFIIAVTAAYFGQKVKGGAEGVGKSTTSAVVFSIFFVIVADSILGLLFYFGETTF